MERLTFLFAALLLFAISSSVSAKDDKKDDLGERIVGGNLTDISKHSHTVSLRYKSCNNTCAFNHRCGGSIITPNIILTAAHCVVGITDSKKLHIVAGSNERNGHGTIIPVKKIISHEDYSKHVAYENDIAVLILELDLKLNDYDMKAINLTDKRPAHNEMSQIAGWGTTTEGGYPSNFLLDVQVPIVSNEICESRYGSGKINKSMLCAGAAKGGKDACQGDSGGPLLVNGKLAGVVSWGNGCARPEYPGVYASVADLKQWIEEAIKGNS